MSFRKRFDNITLNNCDILNIERVINMNAQPSLPTDAQEGELCFFNSKLHIYSNSVWREITQSFTQDVSGLNLTQNGAYIKLQPDSFGGCRLTMRGNGDSAEYSILANKSGFGQYGTGEKLILENFTGNILALKNNFVGIGEIEPERQVHITSSFGEHMRFDSIGSSQYQNKIEFYRAFNNNSDRRKIAEISCHRQLDGGFFQIQTRQNNGNLNNGLFLDCSNNLGINNTSPNNILDVSGSINSNTNYKINNNIIISSNNSQSVINVNNIDISGTLTISNNSTITQNSINRFLPSYKTYYLMAKLNVSFSSPNYVYTATTLQNSPEISLVSINKYGLVIIDFGNTTKYTNLYYHESNIIKNPTNKIWHVKPDNITDLFSGVGWIDWDTYDETGTKITTDITTLGDYYYNFIFMGI